MEYLNSVNTWEESMWNSNFIFKLFNTDPASTFFQTTDNQTKRTGIIWIFFWKYHDYFIELQKNIWNDNHLKNLSYYSTPNFPLEFVLEPEISLKNISS